MDPKEPESKEKKSTLEEWVKANGEDFRSADWIRQRYYSKLNIGAPPSLDNLEKQETVEKEEVSLSIFAQKSGDEIRSRYYQKLISMGIMKETPSKKYQHRTCEYKNSVYIRLGRHAALYQLLECPALSRSQPRN